MNNKVMYWMTVLIAGIFCLTAVPADAKPAGGPGGGGKPPAAAKPSPAPAAKPTGGKKVYPVPGAHGGGHAAPAPSGHRGGGHPAPTHHKDKHHHSGSAFAGGLIGGFLGALIEPAPPPRPAPHYEDRQERVWVEGQWVYGTDSWGRRTQVWEPGHWEVRTVRVWVE